MRTELVRGWQKVMEQRTDRDPVEWLAKLGIRPPAIIIDPDASTDEERKQVGVWIIQDEK